MIKNDKDAMKLIEDLYSLKIRNEDEWSIALEALEQYAPGSTEIIRRAKEFIDPQEVLRLAREKNKPILL